MEDCIRLMFADCAGLMRPQIYSIFKRNGPYANDVVGILTFKRWINSGCVVNSHSCRLLLAGTEYCAKDSFKSHFKHYPPVNLGEMNHLGLARPGPMCKSSILPVMGSAKNSVP